MLLLEPVRLQPLPRAGRRAVRACNAADRLQLLRLRGRLEWRRRRRSGIGRGARVVGFGLAGGRGVAVCGGHRGARPLTRDPPVEGPRTPDHERQDQQEGCGRSRYSGPLYRLHAGLAGPDLLRGPVDHPLGHVGFFTGVGGREGPVGNDVDQPGNPARPLIEGAQRGAPERVAGSAGHLHPVTHVFPGFVPAERRQMVAGGDALRELPQALPLQHLPQFGLAEQHDLQQLVLGRFQVGQQPHLLQRLRAEILRLVDDDHDAAALSVLDQEVSVESIHQRFVAVADPDRVDAQFLADRGQQFTRRHQGIEHESHPGVRRDLFEQTAAQRSLAGAHLPGELDETARTALADTVQQVREGVPVGGAQEHERRVGRNRERRFVQSKMLKVQGDNPGSVFQFEQGCVAPDGRCIHRQGSFRRKP